MKAIVIGNSHYQTETFEDLKHCVDDAKAVAELLEKKLHF
jgi:hypothetical protein